MDKISLSTSAEEADANMIQYLVNKIQKQIRLRASFKKTSLVFSAFDLIDDGDYDRLIGKVISLLGSGCVAKRVKFKCIEISWKPTVMPQLTARDLIHAGFTNYDDFGKIFDALRLAILEGRVNNDTVQANLIWVKEQFGASQIGL